MVAVVYAAYIKKVWLGPCQFSSQKVLDCRPRTGSFTGTVPQSTSPRQSRNSNVGEGFKMIRNSLYSLDIIRADIFLFWRVKTALTGFSLSQESFKLSGGIGRLNHHPRQVCRRPTVMDKTAVKSVFASVVVGPNIILKQLSF
jgi:hypothetical protein